MSIYPEISIDELNEWFDQIEKEKNPRDFYFRDHIFSELIGKYVINIYVSDKLIQFETRANGYNTPHEVFSYMTDADCCSETWIADFMHPNILLNGPIESVTPVSSELDVYYPINDNRCRQEEDVLYGIRFTVTDSEDILRSAVLSFRNSSNGYYGGSLEYRPEMTTLQSHLREISDLSYWINP